MKKFVVDASVAVKWFIPEIHSAAAVRLLEPQIVLCAPDLIGPEVGNTLWKKVRRGEIERDEAGEILEAFGKVPIEIYPSNVLLPAAFDLATALDRSVYDSLYVALAVAQDCVLVTGDRKLHSALAASAVARHVGWIEEEL